MSALPSRAPAPQPPNNLFESVNTFATGALFFILNITATLPEACTVKQRCIITIWATNNEVLQPIIVRLGTCTTAYIIFSVAAPACLTESRLLDSWRVQSDQSVSSIPVFCE